MTDKLVVFCRRANGSPRFTPVRGVPAQRRAAQQYAEENQKEIIAEFIERNKQDWSQFQEAMSFAFKHQATVLIARMGRLTRNIDFLKLLHRCPVPFVCLDSPSVCRDTLDALLEKAEQENRLIRKRLKDSVARMMEQGIMRPGCWGARPPHPGAQKKAVKAASVARTARSLNHYKAVYPDIVELFREARIEAKETHERMHRRLDELSAEYEQQQKTTPRAELPRLTALYRQRCKEARKEGKFSTWDRVCERLTERGYRTIAGMPFTPAAVCRAIKACGGEVPK